MFGEFNLLFNCILKRPNFARIIREIREEKVFFAWKTYRDSVTRITSKIQECKNTIYINGKLQVVVHFLKNSNVSVKKLKKDVISLC